MIPEKLFQQLLVLGEAWRVKSVDYVEQESKVVIRIEERPQLWANQKCPHCEAASVAGYDHAPERSWRHLNVCQLESRSICVNSAWRSARKSSSRKQRTIWKYLSKPLTIRICLRSEERRVGKECRSRLSP